MAKDPVLRRKREAKDLRRRFGLGYVDDEHYGRVIGLLKQVEKGQRLRTEDVAWLRAEAEYCWTDELQKAWHRLEAQALTEAWDRTGDAWNAVNASGHWRKAGEAERALSLTEKALARASLSPKLQSALSTTRGGAMRDLRRLEEAEALGRQAHSLTPGDYRPCTLLGALLLERGDLAGGHDWYAKAEQLGASQETIDQDLRSLLVRLPSQERRRIGDYLLAQDPARFAWLTRRPDANSDTASARF
jgi:Flp pilus assembly protein TadD